MIDQKAELVAGVCPLLFKQEQPETVLVVHELTAKKITGKYVGMWGLGYETVEAGETHRQAIDRYFQEEVRVIQGQVFTPEDLEASKLCIVRISPPEMEAWVHAYPYPVSKDFAVERGDFKDEIGRSAWVDATKVLELEGSRNGIIFRPGTYEIIRAHLEKLLQPDSFVTRIHATPSNLPNWDLFRLLEEGFNQIEALYHLGIDPTLLSNSPDSIRSLSLPESPRALF